MKDHELDAIAGFIAGTGFNENQIGLYLILSNHIDEFEDVHGVLKSKDKKYFVMTTLPNKKARNGSVYVAEADINSEYFSEESIMEILMNSDEFIEYNESVNGSSEKGIRFYKPKYHPSQDSDLLGGHCNGILNDGKLRGIQFDTGTVDGIASKLYLHLNPKA